MHFVKNTLITLTTLIIVSPPLFSTGKSKDFEVPHTSIDLEKNADFAQPRLCSPRDKRLATKKSYTCSPRLRETPKRRKKITSEKHLSEAQKTATHLLWNEVRKHSETQSLERFKSYLEKSDIQSIDCNGNTLLHLAVAKQQQAQVELLLSTISPNNKNYNNHTPLHIAAGTANQPIIEKLIQAGGDIKILDKDGMTPLHYAAQHGDTLIQAMLTQAATSVSDIDSQALLEYAAKKEYISVIDLLCKSMENNANNQQTINLALYTAALKSKKLSVETLLALNADPQAQHKDGNTPLHAAAARGSKSMIQQLLENNANPNIQNQAGATPLHMATQHHKEKTALLLIQSQANPNITANDGTTIETMAKRAKFTKLIKQIDNPDKQKINSKQQRDLQTTH